MENFRSEITLENKISDLKLDLRHPLLNYSLCISSNIRATFRATFRATCISKNMEFLFFYCSTIHNMFRLTSGQKNYRICSQIVFFSN